MSNKVAIIGSGIAGVASAYYLQKAGLEVSLFEASDYFGGHTNTIDVSLYGVTFPVDTGFLVHNDRTYPNLVPFFEELGVDVHQSDMTFSVQNLQQQLHWAGTDLNTVFAQRKNLFSIRFYRFLSEIIRFNRDSARYLEQCDSNLQLTLGQLLNNEGYSTEFSEWYLLPMGGSIWSTPTEKMLEFPAYTFLQFCMNHGLLQLTDRPQWKTVVGGCRTYVKKALANVSNKYLEEPVQWVIPTERGVQITTSHRTEDFDACIICTHPPQTIAMLADADMETRSVLSCFQYQPNTALVHTDEAALPPKRAWAAWNYCSTGNDKEAVSVSYLVNLLQPLPTHKPVIVTLNPVVDIAEEKVLRKINYEHPLFDEAAVQAQHNMKKLQGKNGIYYAGAWMRYGFHEDGILSAKWAINEMLTDHGLGHLKVEVK